MSSLEFGEAVRNSAACSYVVPAAIICFANGKDFDECIRNALSLKGDTQTIAAISVGLAAAYFQETVSEEKEIIKEFGVDEK